ncbi:oxidative stress survival, Svf1-like protein [Atractiella rhizophila]|nr:oxidative stress survival, Svf1-like protein [Atractiella rhizophila]
MSWLFSSAPADGPTLHPCTASSRIAGGEKAGALTTRDTEWQAITSGFIAETQVWYATTKDGALLMAQVIHSSVGLWYPQIQFTFRYHKPGGRTIWKSINVTNFAIGAEGADKRSCSSDQFTITVDPSSPDTYTITGKYDAEVSISWTVKRLTEGWKFGSGPRGGMTYFGPLSEDPVPTGEEPDTKAGGHGYVVHRFWPRCEIKGETKIGMERVEMEESRGIFIHAIQGMRPNLVAARWNFCNFQGEDGTALTQMEFTTTSDYGTKTINVGSIVHNDKLVAVTGGEADESTCKHEDGIVDEDTGYKAPGRIVWNWKDEKASAELKLQLLDGPATKYEPNGLIEKVDVMAEIPYLIKKAVAYAAGTKPYIYQTFNPVEATLTIGGETKQVKGLLFNEATFISE